MPITEANFEAVQQLINERPGYPFAVLQIRLDYNAFHAPYHAPQSTTISKQDTVPPPLSFAINAHETLANGMLHQLDAGSNGMENICFLLIKCILPWAASSITRTGAFGEP